MREKYACAMAWLFLLVVCVFVDVKIYSLYEAYLENSDQLMDRVELIAENVEAENDSYTPNQLADLIRITNERTPDEYLIRFSVWFSILMANVAIIATLVGVILGRRSARKADES